MESRKVGTCYLQLTVEMLSTFSMENAVISIMALGIKACVTVKRCRWNLCL